MFWGILCEIFCENVWGVMLPIDCFAILLVINPMWVMRSFVHLGDVLWVILSHENTCSEYRIPPQNTPEEAHKKHINIEDERYNKYNIVRLCVFCALLRGYFVAESGTPYPTHPPPEDPIFSRFFSIFMGFLGFPLLNQRIFRDFGGVPGGGIFSLIFPWI